MNLDQLRDWQIVAREVLAEAYSRLAIKNSVYGEKLESLMCCCCDDGPDLGICPQCYIHGDKPGPHKDHF